MWIMVAGPYGLVSQSPEKRRENWLRLQAAALAVLEKGHLPVVGLNLALPVLMPIDVPLWDQIADETIRLMVNRVSVSAASRCDAILRIGGVSAGADAEVEAVKARGGAVYRSIDEVPAIATS